MFSGNDHVTILVDDEDGLVTSDHTVEQLLPVKSWGRTFASVALPGIMGASLIRIVSSEKDTKVAISDIRTVTLEMAGDFEEVRLESGEYYWIDSNKPIQVVQFSTSHTSGNGAGDASMMILPSVDQKSNSYHFITPDDSRSSINKNLAVVMVENIYKDDLYVEGNTLGRRRLSNVTAWTDISGSVPLMLGGSMMLEADIYHIFHEDPRVMFHLLLVGFKVDECYSMAMGLRLYPVNTKVCLSRHMIHFWYHSPSTLYTKEIIHGYKCWIISGLCTIS